MSFLFGKSQAVPTIDESSLLDTESYNVVEVERKSDDTNYQTCRRCLARVLKPSVLATFISTGRYEPGRPGVPTIAEPPVVRSAPVPDLARYGVERNPGPGQAPPAFEPVDVVQAYADAAPQAVQDAARAAGRASVKFGDAVTSSADNALSFSQRMADRLSKALHLKGQTNAERAAYTRAGYLKDQYSRGPPIPKYLVGVETNPGPKSAKKTAQRKQKRKAKTQTMSPNMQMSRQQSVGAASSRNYHQRTPKITRGKGFIQVEHTERLATLIGNSTFGVSAFAAQPGLIQVFPWLRTQTSGWEKYKFTKLILHYVPRCGTSTNGSVMMAFDYDAYDGTPVSEASISTYQNFCDDAAWKSQDLSIDMAHSPELYLRSGPVLTADLKTYDFGNIFLATGDATGANIPFGKVYVEYSVKLFSQQAVAAEYQGGSVNEAGGGVTTGNPFGITPTLFPGNIIASVAGNVLNLVNMVVGQKYLITVYITGIALGTASITGAVGGSSTGIAAVNNAAGTNSICQFRLTPGVSSGSISLNLVGTTITVCQFTMSPVSIIN